MYHKKTALIIAEAGVNYNGDIVLAKKMVDVAADAGADIVKFQTGIPENVISKYAQKADYQKINTEDEAGEESQLEMARKLMLPWEVYPELISYCKEKGIRFLSTPFDIPSATFLHELGMKVWKIPSGEITNLPLLRHIAGYGEPIILSTGMSTMDEIEDALSILKNGGAGVITLLQCNTDYPTAYEDANIRAMSAIRERFGVEVGYSDHTMGIEVPIAAVALGASVIEKHFTLDRNMEGPDQIASIEPAELKMMVQTIRNVEKALGTGIKEPSQAEKKNIDIARKSIVAARSIKCGEVYTENNLTCKRPGNGISPMEWDEMIGQKANRDYEEDELIQK
ncbi:MAG: N-acetylneuraminate synthase [Lachnospiraceae bacterium]|nr:N-acetylneuraminate synthase [Lachnospiraceae bacterium]